MATKKYPIGTSIKYVGYCRKCKNQVGKIVGISECNCRIILPQSTCNSFTDRDSIICPWEDIEPFMKKNEQLLFSFME